MRQRKWPHNIPRAIGHGQLWVASYRMWPLYQQFAVEPVPRYVLVPILLDVNGLFRRGGAGKTEGEPRDCEEFLIARENALYLLEVTRGEKPYVPHDWGRDLTKMHSRVLTYYRQVTPEELDLVTCFAELLAL